MAKIYIPSKELIKTLNITSQELVDIEKFFDSIPDDDWELNEGKDYRVVAGSGLREYTESGAYTIARYLEATKKQNFWDILTDWIFHTKEKIRQSFVRRKILENSASLMKRSDYLWISRADTVAIFGTRSDYLTKMAEYTQQKDYALIKGQDFDDFIDEGGLYFSIEGIGKLSKAFEECLVKKNRKAECKDVGKVIHPQIKDIVEQIKQREKQVESAKKRAKRRDKTCLVTKCEGNRIEPISLAAHHLYSRNEYPHLIDSLDNLITISCDIHEQFHTHYMGGSHKACTIDHFINFVQQYYPSNTEVVIWLQNKKLSLGKQEPVGKSNPPHVLYLPYSRVS